MEKVTLLSSGHKKESYVCCIWFYMLGTYIKLRKRNDKRNIFLEIIAENLEVLRNFVSFSGGIS